MITSIGAGFLSRLFSNYGRELKSFQNGKNKKDRLKKTSIESPPPIEVIMLTGY